MSRNAKTLPEKGYAQTSKGGSRCDSQNEKKPFHKFGDRGILFSEAFLRQGVPRMLKSKKFPVLQVMLCVLAVLLCPLALTSCPGNGEAAGSHDDETYTPGGSGGGEGASLTALIPVVITK